MNSNLVTAGKYVEKLYTKMCDKVSKKYGISILELNILLFLKNNPGYDTARDLVEISHLSKSNISDAIEELTKKEYLTGKQDTNDRRYIHLKIEDKANQILIEGCKVHRSFLKIACKGFTRNEIKIFKTLFNKSMENMKEAYEAIDKGGL